MKQKYNLLIIIAVILSCPIFVFGQNQTAEQIYNKAMDIYYGKNGETADQTKSISYFKQAAEKGYLLSQRYMGNVYYYGTVAGYPCDYGQAKYWYEQGAKQNDGYSIYYCGLIHLNGYGVQKNRTKAAEYFLLSAKNGYDLGQHFTGMMYYTGSFPNIPKDYIKAFEWFKKAAEQSFAESYYYLGIMYTNGEGVSVNYDQALYNFNKSLSLNFNPTLVQSQIEKVSALKKEKDKKDIVVVTGSLPELTWLSPETAENTDYALSVGIKSKSTISQKEVYLNGQLSRGISSIVNDGYDMKISQNIQLHEGQNEIKVVVTNEAGSTTIQRNITLSQKPVNIIVHDNIKRLALVIGNSNYTNATKLPNPKNDASDIAASLRALGFTVIEKHDLSLKEFKNAISEFGNMAASYDASMLYYAGHAIEKDGKNYLIPVDAVLEKQIDIEYECVRADYVLDNLEAAKSKMNIIVLDACRNNPISRGWSRSSSRGLASMVVPAGTFMVFSTSPGSTAADGDGKNSPFTTAFLKCLSTPNVPVYQFFVNVSKEVKSLTGNVQRPWITSDLDGDFYFNIR